MTGQTTAEVLHRALEPRGTKHVLQWRRGHLGATLRSKRGPAYAKDKKPDEIKPPST